MFRCALVASDLSPASDYFIRCLHGLRPLGTERIVLIHALGLRYLEEDMGKLLSPHAEPKLGEQRQVLENQGFQVETVIAPGVACWEIKRVATEKQASMIVVGSHGASSMHTVLLGSVAQQVSHHTEVPVFVVRRDIDRETEQASEMNCSDFHEHVLFSTDFSDIAERAFTYVEGFVRSGCRRATLLHVQDKSRIYGHLMDKLEQFNRIDRERLERMEGRLRELGATEVSIDLPYGLPKQQIIERANQGDCSVIVMGTQGRGYFGELFMGSVAFHVARRAVVPTLLVPPLR